MTMETAKWTALLVYVCSGFIFYLCVLCDYFYVTSFFGLALLSSSESGRHYSLANVKEVYFSYFLGSCIFASSIISVCWEATSPGRRNSSASKGFPADGAVEELGPGRDGKYRYRYTEGPRDKAFMEQKDREYLMALKDDDDPEMQARFEEEFASLDLSLEHHRNLKREFEPFTRAYREAAGSGEGGGPQPPAAGAVSTLLDHSETSTSSDDSDASAPPSAPHEEAAGSDERDGEAKEDRSPAHEAAGGGGAGGQLERVFHVGSRSKLRIIKRAFKLRASFPRERDDQVTMSALRRQIDQQAAQLRTFQTELRAIRTEHTQVPTTTAALRDQAERLSASQARASELEASLERLRAERAEDRRLLERHSGSLARLGETSDSHATALATLQANLTESTDAQRRALQESMEDLETRLGRLSSETRDTKRGSLQLKASYEQFRASLALAGHLMIRVDRPALTLGDSLGEGDLTVAHEATWQEIPCVYQHLKLTDISDADALTFRREALSLITMKHPRLTIPYAYTDRPCGVLMPRKVSLQARIAGSPLRWEMRYRIAHDMAQGLAYLHEQGQVHGHLKPANVLLDDDERASLSDFGMSQTRRLAPTQNLAYLAPETQKRDVVNDERSDVYSFGMILWSMATGRAPFSSTPDISTLRAWVAAGEKETLPAGTPAPYKDSVERCWLPPEERPRAQDLVRTLGHVLRLDSGSTDLSLGRSGGLSGAMHSLRASYLNLPESSHTDAPLGVIHPSSVATETSPGSIPPPGTDAAPSPRT